ncbi:MAG TPA: hypothetical protein VLH75_00950 [Longimicrobiales bacterium]|nr:hypothetical protein [Longimicrobiales bacterium]
MRAAKVPPTAPPPEATDRPAPELFLEADGVRWAVRELGRSRSSHATLVLVGFFHPEEAGEPRREAWMVARSLEHVTHLQLEEAWRSGGPFTPPGARKPFFPEIADRGGKEG